ncbi:MAG: hypothetical protein JW940_27390 [Polyangiaceae bacterium]|nr:hypothetical protein [Polyangiaceae bacterium]
MDPVFDERDGNFLVRCRSGSAQTYEASRWSPPPPPPPADTMPWQPLPTPANAGGPNASAGAGVSSGSTLSYPLLGAGTGGVDLGY